MKTTTKTIAKYSKEKFGSKKESEEILNDATLLATLESIEQILKDVSDQKILKKLNEALAQGDILLFLEICHKEKIPYEKYLATKASEILS